MPRAWPPAGGPPVPPMCLIVRTAITIGAPSGGQVTPASLLPPHLPPPVLSATIQSAGEPAQEPVAAGGVGEQPAGEPFPVRGCERVTEGEARVGPTDGAGGVVVVWVDRHGSAELSSSSSGRVGSCRPRPSGRRR